MEQTFRLSDFRDAVHQQNTEQAYYLWASTWERFLHKTSGLELDWSVYSGRATGRQQYRQPTFMRASLQVQTEEEKSLWRLLGLLQGHRQGRIDPLSKARHSIHRLYAQVLRHRSLPPLDLEDSEAVTTLESSVRNAIKAERIKRVAARRTEWKSALNLKNGNNSLSRRMIRGAKPRLHLLQHNGESFTCPADQCRSLDSAWQEIHNGASRGQAHAPVYFAQCGHFQVHFA
eukprot:6369847-Amphidinium_carterae.1